MTKLYIARRRGQRRVPFWASPDTAVTLLSLKDRYGELAGREVSHSIIIRRALEVLAKTLPKAKPEAELKALMKHLR